jgi:hypothetical protein
VNGIRNGILHEGRDKKVSSGETNRLGALSRRSRTVLP